MDEKLGFVKAVGYALLISAGYVGVLYVHDSTRPSTTRSRDDEDVILRRMILISLYSAAVIVALIPGILYSEAVYGTWWYAWQSLHIQFGLYELFWAPLMCLLTTAVLFIGPLVSVVLFDYNLNMHLLFHDIKVGISDLFGIRNFVIGPLTEELVFRSGIMALFLAAGASRTMLIFGSPLFFGVAHVHHAYESRIRGIPPKIIAFSALFQFAYTTAFGWYSAYLFIRTGTVWSCFFVHAFCNSMGVPDWTLDTTAKTRAYRVLLFVGLSAFVWLVPKIPSHGPLS